MAATDAPTGRGSGSSGDGRSWGACCSAAATAPLPAKLGTALSVAFFSILGCLAREGLGLAAAAFNSTCIAEPAPGQPPTAVPELNSSHLWIALGPSFFAANCLGCFLMGLLHGLKPAALARRPRVAALMHGLGTGFCGSLTTFAGWMTAAGQALAAGQWGQWANLLVLNAMLYVAFWDLGYEAALGTAACGLGGGGGSGREEVERGGDDSTGAAGGRAGGCCGRGTPRRRARDPALGERTALPLTRLLAGASTPGDEEAPGASRSSGGGSSTGFGDESASGGGVAAAAALTTLTTASPGGGSALSPAACDAVGFGAALACVWAAVTVLAVFHTAAWTTWFSCALAPFGAVLRWGLGQFNVDTATDATGNGGDDGPVVAASVAKPTNVAKADAAAAAGVDGSTAGASTVATSSGCDDARGGDGRTRRQRSGPGRGCCCGHRRRRCNFAGDHFPVFTAAANFLGTLCRALASVGCAYVAGSQDCTAVALLSVGTIVAVASGFCGSLSTVSTFVTELKRIRQRPDQPRRPLAACCGVVPPAPPPRAGSAQAFRYGAFSIGVAQVIVLLTMGVAQWTAAA